MSQGTGMNYRSLAGNMVVAFAAQGISFFASVAMSLLVPKVLGVETYGYWQLFIIYASYSGFFMLGLNDGIYLIEGGNTRGEIDKRAVNSQFRFGMVFQLVVAAVIAVIAVVWAPEAQRSFVLLAFALYTVLCNLAGFLGYIFQSMNETKLFSYSTMIDRLVFLAIILVMVFIRVPDFEPYVFAYLISKACSLAYCIVRSRDFFAAGALPLTETARLSLLSMKVGFALMISNVASMLVLGVARALVDNAWGIEAFGHVSFWLSMVNFFITFVSQASMVLFPALRQGTEGERRAFYHFVRDMMEVAFPVVYLLYFPMAWVLSLWLPQYADTMHYFAILLPVCVFDTKMNLCCTTYFKVLREERTLLKVNLCTLAGSIALCTIGVYVIGSLDAVLLGTVACIVCRSLWSERHLNAKIGVSGTPAPIEEVVLTTAFVALALCAPALVAVLAYLALYAAYLVLNRHSARDSLDLTKRVFTRGK